MQSLVYIFIGLAALGIGGAAYFGFTFTPIESFVTALAFLAIAIVLLERTLRRRSEARLEKGIEELSRLLATDAQAGSVLSQRVNALADQEAGRRIEGLEADISVLGTVIRQVAEAVAELERTRSRPAAATEPESDPDTFPEPVISISVLRRALDQNRLVCHVEPILQLPQRRRIGYAIVPRLHLEDGAYADPPDYMPHRGGEDALRRIEAAALAEAVAIARRSRSARQPVVVHIPFSSATLADADALEAVLATLDANTAILQDLVFAVTLADFRKMSPQARAGLVALARTPATLLLDEATSLRIDFAELESLNFRFVRINAGAFLDSPQGLTDFAASDIAAYARRFSVQLAAAGVVDEQQVLGLFEDGVALVQGPYIGAPALAPAARLANIVAPAPRRA